MKVGGTILCMRFVSNASINVKDGWEEGLVQLSMSCLGVG